LPAKNDDAVFLIDRGALFAGKPRSYRDLRFNRRRSYSPESSSPVALLEFLAVAAGARVVAADVFQGVAHRFLVGVAAVWAVDMAMVVIMVVVMVMIVVAVRAMDVGLLGHRGHSGIKSAAIITPLRARCT
jgi:hypothetical protein